MSHITSSIKLTDGLDLVTPALLKKPSRLIACKNYESASNGYRRIDGFERFDGHPAPSAASYWAVPFSTGTANITAGQTVTGVTSGASATVLVNAVVTSGSFGGGNAVGILYVTAMTGSFVAAENLQVGGVTKALSTAAAGERSALDDPTDATYYQASIELARSLIAQVPGSGPMRGVWYYAGACYAFRDNVGATACVMYKSSATGWQAQTLGKIISFTAGGGAYQPQEGDVITGATSGATATIRRICTQSGSWGGTTMVGQFVVSGQAGVFVAENLNIGAHATVAHVAGDTAAITMLPGGKFEFFNTNFYGSVTTQRMYGCDGVNKAFEWDGTYFTPISTGMGVDTPTHITEHKKFLWLTYRSGSVQYSALGQPTQWQVILGAGEIAIGELPTGITSGITGTLVIWGRRYIGVLYGSSSSDFQLVPFARDSGAIEWSPQLMSEPVYMDDAGLRKLSATQAYGNFLVGSLTMLVKPIFDLKKAQGATPVASVRVRSKTIYRIYFSDGTGVAVYFGRTVLTADGSEQPEHTYFDLGKRVYAICSADDSTGKEVLFLGSDDGYVYQLDSGTSFDGAAVDAYFRLAFNNLKSPRQKKRFIKAVFECDAAPSAALKFTAEFSYADPGQPPAGAISLTVSGGGGFWSEASNWNQFYWSSPVHGVAEARLDGIGTSVSFAVVSSSIYETPHTFHGLTVHYTPRGLVR